MNNIKAIIFDLGGVLLDIDYDKTREAFEHLGVNNFHSLYSQADANPLFQKLETGNITEDEFYEQVKILADKNVTKQMIMNAWNAMLLNFRKESILELKRLKKKYKIFLLSNTNYIHLQAFNKIYQETVADVPFEILFDKVYFSHELGLRKPNVEPFQYVLKENNLIPSETLFIDDSLQNVEGAKNVGMQTIHFKTGMTIENLGL